MSVNIVAPVASDSPYPSGTSPNSILTSEALAFVALLHRTFNRTRLELLSNRQAVQARLAAGEELDFIRDPQIAKIRSDPVWQGAVPGPRLADRRAEITGPPERNMVVNALNADVKTYMADFEDSSSPTWSNMVNGQVNLYDAVREQVDFVNSTSGKSYIVDRSRQTPVILVRPRGWHMEEKHVLVDGEPVLALLFDFGLYFFHNATEAVARGFGPYFYLPKMEHHLEARLWNTVFNVAQDYVGLPRGTVRATVLIETLPAAFQMEEIIYELRAHSAGLNCGRWDYIFSTIKRLIDNPGKVLPNRGLVTMQTPFMHAYCQRLVNVCHRRGVHAMGGMAAQIPIKNDPEANAKATEKVRSDKLREARMGFDGTWVAHPALASIANSVFNSQMPTPNQMFVIPAESVTAADLTNTTVADFCVSEAGIRENLYIALCYMELWLRGMGCVPINNLMEDAATAEVSRLMLHSWVKHGVRLDSGEKVTPQLMERLTREEVQRVKEERPGAQQTVEIAARYLLPEVRGESLSEFLTTLVYEAIA